MKKTLYILAAAVASLVSTALLSSCDQTDAERDRDATPKVEYVRVTNPNAADSLVVEATMGAQIVLMGSNLGDVQEIWFNDVKGLLNPTLITSYSIIVEVPSVIPTEVTNEIRLVTSTGRTATFPFGVRVPNPLIREISCEYAKAGDEIEITGNYFIDPAVYFEGASSPAEIIAATQTSIRLKVPEGVVEGPVTVESIYGRTKTKFNFLETNGMICNFDDGYVQPWGRGTVTTGDDAISGNYLLMEAPSLSAWGWNESLMWGYWGYGEGGRGNVPIAQGDVSRLALKFEAYIETWVDVPLMMWFQRWTPEGNISPDDNYPQCHWKPWIKNSARVDAATGGWRTFTIPLSEFRYNKEESASDLAIDDITKYTDFNIMVFGACDQPGPLKMMLDNFRIVRIN
ncbi:MAG: glycan-binding surface protein [Bacteroidales bacterium]|nr:glycan-binding surface protein [Bacteroidales bacterium]